jgi:DICT domain-containing protein
MGPGMSPEPGDGVRGANIDPNDELFDEWGIAVISPHFACAFVGRPFGNRNVPDADRQYQFALTYNREFAIETARNMMSKISPHVPTAQMGAAPTV